MISLVLNWQIALVHTENKPIEKFKELNSNIEKFKKDNEELINQLKEAKENNNFELEKLKLEYNARIEEAKARAEITQSNNNRSNASDLLGLMLGGIMLNFIGGGARNNIRSVYD